MRIAQSLLCASLVWCLGVLVPARQLQAAAVGTDALVQHARGAEAHTARDRVLAIFDRADVVAEMERLGVDPLEARARIAALGDAELEQIAGRLDQLPAGESLGGAILLILVVAFVALVITDAIGVTDVFPWIRKPVR
jgi:hypothetical protein